MPSIMQRIGTPNSRHNLDKAYRSHLDNVDPELSQYNEVIRRRSVEDIYEKHLQPAFDEFNAKQKRKDRRLDVKWNCTTALEYQRALDKTAQQSKNRINQKGRPPIREIVWQIGNPEQGFGCKSQTEEMRELAKTMLLECQAKAEERYKQFAWGDCVFHADEVTEDAAGKELGTDHLHASFVPLCLKNKQGPDVQVAFERCLKEMGFETFEAWKHDLDQIMEEVLSEHGLERIFMDNHEEHRESKEFHRQQKIIRETQELQRKRDEIDLEIKWVESNIDDITRSIVEESIERVTEDQSGVYDNTMFLISECSDERFEELDDEGSELMRNVLNESFEDIINATNLSKTIQQIEDRKERTLNWNDRMALWEKYREISNNFWEFRNELDLEYQLERQTLEENARKALKMYYDTKYFLAQTRSVAVMIIVTFFEVFAELKVTDEKLAIKQMENEYKKLMTNTATFKKFSNTYREDLKAGRIPSGECLKAMENVVKMMDRKAAICCGRWQIEREVRAKKNINSEYNL